MSTSLFIISFILIGGGLYFSVNRKLKKREKEFNEFAYEMQREFIQSTPSVNSAINYYETVKSFYEKKGYSISKHPDFSSDYIGKKGKEILFIRVQGPENKESITARLFQSFVGQTVLYALSNPLYEAYTLKWVYVCSKMMCDQSARIYIKKYEGKLSFELIEAV